MKPFSILRFEELSTTAPTSAKMMYFSRIALELLLQKRGKCDLAADGAVGPGLVAHEELRAVAQADAETHGGGNRGVPTLGHLARLPK